MVSVYEVVRDRILSSLEAGTVPWRQTWQSLSPMNIATGKPYRGINRLLLSGHTWWGTYNQIRRAGGHVRRGEKASGMVVFWSCFDTEKVVNENGEQVTVALQRDRPLVRYYKVFNLSQCEGIEVEPAGEARPGITEPIRFGSERYSREELTAELGAAFLCAMTGTDVPVAENQAAYIAGWLRHIRDGSAADVIRAAADAQRAADFLTGGGEEGSSSLSGVVGRASFLPVVAAEHRPGSSWCTGSLAPSLARHGLAYRLFGARRSHHRLRRACSWLVN